MKKGDSGYYRFPNADEAILVRVVRRSKRTGTLSVALLMDAAPYKTGDIIHVEPYEVKPSPGETK